MTKLAAVAAMTVASAVIVSYATVPAIVASRVETPTAVPEVLDETPEAVEARSAMIHDMLKHAHERYVAEARHEPDLAELLAPDGSADPDSVKRFREGYRADIARYGKYSVVVCSFGGHYNPDYRKCLNIREELAR